eukprot:2119960-Alexandrium_andersonii.AAC.1
MVGAAAMQPYSSSTGHRSPLLRRMLQLRSTQLLPSRQQAGREGSWCKAVSEASASCELELWF